MTEADRNRLGQAIYWTCVLLSVVLFVFLLLYFGPAYAFAASFGLVEALTGLLLMVLPPLLLYGLGYLLRYQLAEK